MPDKAIDLIDEAASSVKLASLDADSGSDKIAKAVALRERDVAGIVSEWTGIPLDHIHATVSDENRNLEERLNSSIFGQQEAVSQISKAIRRAQAGLNDPDRPLGVFMLLGPSGVGKTALSKALSEALFSRGDALIRIDMSEYSEEATISRLIGSPPGYVGHGDGGQLTDAVLKQPYSVVLFDEIEKAHPKVFSLLLQLLDDGLLTDSVGRKVNFKNTVIMMTTNAGISFEMDKQVGFSASTSESQDEKRRKIVLDRAKQIFRPEFLGRVDEMIVMKSLDATAGKEIAALHLKQIADRLIRRGIHVSVTDSALRCLSGMGVNRTSGARGLKHVIREKVENPLSEMLLSDANKHEFLIDCLDDEISINTL